MTPPRRRYRTDLTNAQWQVLAPLIPAPKPGGRPAIHQRRELVNAMLYRLRTGCAWRLLPHDLPPWQTVYHYFRCWRLEGRWPQIVRMLHARQRVRQGRRPTPSAAILDSQSVKTTERGATRLRRRQEGQRPQAAPAGRHVGPAAGRARDPADVSDRDGAAELLRRLDRRHLPRLRYGWADGGSRGGFLAWALARSKIAFEVVARADGGRRRRWIAPGEQPPIVPTFAVVPRRWVVERTFAWLGRFRRLSKDYEYLPATSEAVIQLA